MSRATCETCAYRDGQTCRRFPPTAAVGAGRLWPSVHPDKDWCGEHSPDAPLAVTARPKKAR